MAKNKTTEVAVGQVKVQVKERNKSIPLAEFLPRLHALAAEGKTQKECAIALGMEETSLSVRLTNIRKMKDEDGNVVGPALLPKFTGASKGKKIDVGAMVALVNAAKAKIEAGKAQPTDAPQG